VVREEIVAVRAFVQPEEPASSGGSGAWVEGHIASPLAVYDEYRVRSAFDIRGVGALVVEVETRSGVIGCGQAGMTGEPAAWVVEHVFAPLILGQSVTDVHQIWDRMHRGSLHLARRGIPLHALSAVDLAVWDALGRVRDEPVYALLGGAVRDSLPLYSTGPRPDIAAKLGFMGAKVPLSCGLGEGDEGLQRNIDEFAGFRAQVGPDFPLALDCWMSLDQPYACRLVDGLVPHGLWFIEEALSPEDYWGFADLRRHAAGRTLVATGEHEGLLAGFRLLIEMGCVDMIQPDLGWCGGLTEALRIATLAEAHGVPMVPHTPGAYGFHLAFARSIIPFGEMIIPGPTGDETDLAAYLPPDLVPVDGVVRPSDRPGFGLTIDTSGLRRLSSAGG
jgi:L-rhamnonate dehydratase